MNKMFVKGIQTITVLAFFIGVLTILSATQLGQRQANAYLRKSGGSMETSKYNMIMETNIINYRWAGTVVACIGGIGFITFTNTMYQKET